MVMFGKSLCLCHIIDIYFVKDYFNQRVKEILNRSLGKGEGLCQK